MTTFITLNDASDAYLLLDALNLLATVAEETGDGDPLNEAARCDQLAEQIRPLIHLSTRDAAQWRIHTARSGRPQG